MWEDLARGGRRAGCYRGKPGGGCLGEFRKGDGREKLGEEAGTQEGEETQREGFQEGQEWGAVEQVTRREGFSMGLGRVCRRQGCYRVDLRVRKR